MDINYVTIEDLDAELQKTLNDIDDIALQVSDGKLDAYSGFMQTEKYNEKLADIKRKLEEMGVDINSIIQNY